MFKRALDLLFARKAPPVVLEPFPVLLERARRSAPDLDFAALREAYTRTGSYRPQWDSSDKRKAMYRAWNETKHVQAFEIAEEMLAGNYLDLDCHELCRRASLELEDPGKAEHHRFMVEGLLGASRREAFLAISAIEEHAFLRVTGLQFLGQSLVQAWGHHYDVLRVREIETGSVRTVYFNIDFIWKHKSSHFPR
jgi:hypothetical protein